MGLGWDPIKTKGGLFGFGSKTVDVDLDASVLLFDAANKQVDVVWFQQLQSRDGSIRHTGDNRTGEGEGDDERIVVMLDLVPPQVKSLVFTVNSFTGQDFSQVANAYCRLVNGADNKEVARYDLSIQGRHSAQIMARLYRHNGEWKLHAIGENGSGTTFDALIPQIANYL